MTSVALYTLADQYRVLAQKLADMDLDATTVADTIESTGITDEIAAKAQGCELVARTLVQFNPAIEAEIARLQKLKVQREQKAAALRKYVLDNMLSMGMDRIETPFFTLSVRSNPGSVDVYEQGLIPASFMRQPDTPPPVPDKAAIGKAIKAGQEVPGCRLIAGQRLDIK